MSLTGLRLRPQSNVVPYGTRADVPYGCGNVHAQAVVVGFDRARRASVYALRVANNSEHALEARVAVRRGGSLALSLAPFSIVESLVPGAEDGAMVRVLGKGLAFTLDVPRVRHRIARFPVAAAVLAFAGALLTAGSVIASTNPTLMRARPQATATPRVIVQTTTVVRDVEQPPLLDELDVPDAVIAGRTLRVRYGAHAPGTVYVVDEHGSVWAHAALTPSGETPLLVPAAAAGHVMRVVAVAKQGSRHAEMSTHLAVLPNAAIQPASPTPAPALATGALAVPARVVAGRPFEVRLDGAHADAVVSLNDASGTVIEQLDVRARDHHVTLDAPMVSRSSTVDVVVSLSRGAAVEEVVRAVRVIATNE